MEMMSKPKDVGLSSARLARIRPWIQDYLDAEKLRGATILVARHGKAVFSESFGFRDLEAKQPMTADTILRFYSMTKPITSVAMMMLYEQGFFQLDTPVAEFIPSFKDVGVYVFGEDADMVTEPQNIAMTLHHLLTHTSGLTYGFGNAGLIPELYQERHTDFEPHDGSLEEVVDRLAQIPLEFQPGQRWNYGVSFDVLGRVVEVVSGKPLDAFFKEHIFEPLGMKDTGFYLPESKVKRLVLVQKPSDDGKWVRVEGWGTAEEAKAEVLASIKMYQDAPEKPYF